MSKKGSFFSRRKLLRFYAKITREQASPEYIARGWAIGMFCGCLLPFGVQLCVSIPLSFLLKGSKIGASFGTLVTNHVTIFFIYPAQCYVGSLMLGGHFSWTNIQSAMASVLEQQSWASLFALGWELVAAFFIGGAILTGIMTPITYWGVKKFVITRRNRKLAAKA